MGAKRIPSTVRKTWSWVSHLGSAHWLYSIGGGTLVTAVVRELAEISVPSQVLIGVGSAAIVLALAQTVGDIPARVFGFRDDPFVIPSHTDEGQAATRARETAQEIRTFLQRRDKARPGPGARTPSGLDSIEYDEETKELAWRLASDVWSCHRAAQMEIPGDVTGLEGYISRDYLTVEELRQVSVDLDRLADRLPAQEPPTS